MRVPSERPGSARGRSPACTGLAGDLDAETHPGDCDLNSAPTPYERIGEAERDAWLGCMRKAMAATIADVELREGLDSAFADLAGHMRNQTPAAP